MPSANKTRLRALATLTAIAVGYVIARALAQNSGTTDLVRLPPAALYAAACTLAAITAAARARLFNITALATITTLACAWGTTQLLQPPSLPLADAANARAIVTVEGVATEHAQRLPQPRGELAPFARFFDAPATAFSLEVTRVANEPARTRLEVLATDDPTVRAGDRVRITARLEPIPAPLNPGERDSRLHANQSRLAAKARTSAALIEPAPSAPTLRERASQAWHTARGALRERAQRALGDPTDNPARALAHALTLGQRDPALRSTQDAFQRVGLSHLLAISGFHLVVMAAVALAALRLTGDRGWLEPASLAALLLIYLLLVPANAPVVRAALLVIACLAADALGRRHDRVTLLIWLACALAIARPMDVFSLGFQLSFGLTTALVALAPRLHRHLFPPKPLETKRSRLYRIIHPVLVPARALFTASLLCWACAVPVVIAHTGHLSPFTVLAACVTTPIIVVLLWVAYAALAVGIVIPAATVITAPLTDTLAQAAIAAVRTIDAVPGAQLAMPPAHPWVPAPALAAIGLLGALLLVSTTRRRLALSALAIYTLILAHAGLVAHKPAPGVSLRLDTLAVGDGSCHLLRTHDAALLFDCGSLSSGLGTRTAPRALQALGVRTIPVAVISHANSDHFNALPDIAEHIGLRHCLIGPSLEAAAAQPGSAPEALLTHLRSLGVRVTTIQAGDRVHVGSITLDILHPEPGDAFEAENDRSLVALVSAPDAPNALMLTGDIQRDAIAALQARHPSRRPRVLELPHHGSAHPAAIDYTRTLSPQAIVQSTGPTRASDPRWAPVRAQTPAWITTATDGAASVRWHHDGTLTVGAHRLTARQFSPRSAGGEASTPASAPPR